MSLGRQCQTHQISAPAATQVMVWTAIISNSEDTLIGYRTGMGRRVHAYYKEEGMQETLSLPCSLEGFSSNNNWIRKIQQRWWQGSNAGITVPQLWFWLMRTTFVHIHTLYNTKHRLEIQLLSETRGSVDLLHTLISWVILSKSFYFPVPQLPVCRLREKTGFPLYCHCLP